MVNAYLLESLLTKKSPNFRSIHDRKAPKFGFILVINAQPQQLDQLKLILYEILNK